jgi:hypothetical protein
MKKCFRFAVIGDTHYCWQKHHPAAWQRNGPASNIPDYIRYMEMLNTGGIPLLRKLADMQPELLISTGDYVEGGLNDKPEYAAEEILDGWTLLNQAGIPVMIAKGTHEGGIDTPGGRAFREQILPKTAAGSVIFREYYRYDLHGCVFLILDYLQFEPGGEQESWLIDELEQASRTARHIYIFAHPPLYLWGRHFFDTPGFAVRIEKLCRKYPVDAYFCGHTHNQSVSFHRTESNGNGFLQLTGSAVGYPDMPVTSLDTYHRIAEYDTGDQYLWGILEDSAPGFFMVEVDGNETHIEWHSMTDSASLMLPARRLRPVCLKQPSCAPADHRLSDHDLYQIKGAWINIFSVIRGNNDSEIKINGVALGAIPENVSYAARRFITLPEHAVNRIGLCNRVEISMPHLQVFALGSISLEVLLYDGRLVRSHVAPENMVCGQVWQEYRHPERFHYVKPGETVTINVIFNPATMETVNS